MGRGRADVRRVAQGRYWREREARVVLEAWRSSGEKLAEFAQRHEFEPRRLARWVHRLEGQRPVRFHAVRLVQQQVAEPEGSIEIELASGERLHVPRGFEAEDLRRLLRVLREEATC